MCIGEGVDDCIGDTAGDCIGDAAGGDAGDGAGKSGVKVVIISGVTSRKLPTCKASQIISHSARRCA